MSRLKRIREARRANPDQLARELGVAGAWYPDLENDSSRLGDEISIAALRKLARALDVSPSALLSARGEVVSTAKYFVERLESHLLATHTPADVFSEKVGWNVSPMIADPANVRTLNAEAFRAICAAIGLDWQVVLDEMAI